MSRCFNCEKEGNMKKCSGCQHAFYCSKNCQKEHWDKHKSNCLPQGSSIHELFKLCKDDILPSIAGTVARDYGFDNMRFYYGDISWGDFASPCTAEQILFGVFQLIWKDVGNLELGDTIHTFNSIGASKKMIVEACERNTLDEFIHRYISNVFSRRGHASPLYFFGWIWNRLVIGPTRTQGLTKEQVQKMRNEIYHKYYGSTTPANCCCVTLGQEPTVKHHMPFLF